MFFTNPLTNRLNIVKHEKEISDQKLWPFVLSSIIENKKIAGIYNAFDSRYELETPDGIGIAVSLDRNSSNTVVIYLMNAIEQTKSITQTMLKDSDIQEVLLKIKRCIQWLRNDGHKNVKLSENNTLKNIVKERIMKKNFNFDDFVTIEQNIAYSEAFFELIKSGQIYEFEYFSKKRKLDINSLPKGQLIDPVMAYCNISSTHVRKTSTKNINTILSNRATRLSSDKFSEIFSWSQYDSKKKVQICMNRFVSSEFPIDAGESSFYINTKKETINQVVGNQFSVKLKKAFSASSTPLASLSGSLKSLNNLVTLLSKGCFLNKYIICGQASDAGALMPLEMDGQYFLIDAKSAYYAIREAIYFIEENETFSLKLYKDKVIFTSSFGKKIAFSSILITEDQAFDSQFMRNNFSLYTPVNILYLMCEFQKHEAKEEDRPEIRKVRVLSKIEDFIQKNTENPNFHSLEPINSKQQLNLSL